MKLYFFFTEETYDYIMETEEVWCIWRRGCAQVVLDPPFFVDA